MKNIISLVNSHNAFLVKNDKWQYLKNPILELNLTSLLENNISLTNIIVPFEQWLTVNNNDTTASSAHHIRAFSIENTTDVSLVKPWLDMISLIVLDFPHFTDGRAYSQAVEIRRHLGWQGEIRANGHVLRDQLSHMYRCGFNSFAISDDRDPIETLKGLQGISVLYANSVTDPEPLFRRRLL